MQTKDFKNLIKDIVYISVFFFFFITFGWLAFHIPSSSMEPTLEVGDRIFVSKWAYGYNRYSIPFYPSFIGEKKLFGNTPKRGDVAVFTKNNIEYIKRVIGLPGDRIQVKEGRLYINGTKIHRKLIREVPFTDYHGQKRVVKEYDEFLPNSEKGKPQIIHRIYEASDYDNFDNTPEYLVPDNYLFVMGDNRDNSIDSRASLGLVKKEYFFGKAQITTFSLYDCDQGKPIYCPAGIPLGRFFNLIK